MLRKSKWLLVPAAALAAASLMVSGCFGKTREHELQEAADAINAAIEHDLALDRYEFMVSKGALFDEKNYDGQKTTYICVSGDGGRDYYITTSSSDKSSTLTVEHELLGDDHYYRIFDKEKDEYHIPSDAGSDTGSHPGLVEKGWVYDTTDSPSGNEDYKKRLWIYGHRIAPEDFAEASIDKDGGWTTISLSRSPEQLKESSLPSKVMYDEAMDWYQRELAKDDLKQYERSSLEAKQKELEETGAEAIDRNYTAETLKAVIDSSGRLLTIEYRLSYDYGQEIDGETVRTITQYSNATLERSNDDSIVLPE